MRKSLWIIPFLFAVIGAPSVLRAQIITFTVSGSLTPSNGASCSPSPCTLGGTLTVNDLTGAFISGDVTMSGESPTAGPFTIYSNPFPSGFDGYTELFLDDSDSDVAELFISTSTAGSWAAFDGGSILPSVSGTSGVAYSAVCAPPGCVADGPDHWVLSSGSLTPTPEPSSYLLLGTGLLGLLALTLRSKRHAPPSLC
jgi:PEP-CTERM motif